MQSAFLPVFVFVVCAIALALGLLAVAGLLNPGRPNRVIRMPYESGMDPIHDTHRRFDVRFHLLAIAFLVFDVELLFLYPWAVAFGGGPAGRVHGSEVRVQGSELSGQGSEKYVVARSNQVMARSLDRATCERRGQETMPQQVAETMPQQVAETVPQQVGRDTVSQQGASNPLKPPSPAPRTSPPTSRPFVFAGAMTFLILLTLGYVYDWRKGIFQWR